MASKVLLVCAVGALASCASAVFYNIEDAEDHFEIFIKTHNKTYSDETEKQARFQIFKDNLEEINKRNNMGELDLHGITKFADLTIEEFKSKYTGHRNKGAQMRGYGASYCKTIKVSSLAIGMESIPDEHDWRKLNKVSNVKYQGECGSCWAFSTIGNVESQYAMVHNKIKTFSEQQLVDCDYDDCGCCGGTVAKALEHLLKENEGLMSDEDYAYESRGKCRFDKDKVVANVTGCIKFDINNEEDLKKALYNFGPLSIALDATPFQSFCFHGQVQNCIADSLTINHAVLLVGYGTSDKGEPYWIIKNSWGEGWGEAGYVRLLRGVNSCNLLYEAPVVAVVA